MHADTAEPFTYNGGIVQPGETANIRYTISETYLGEPVRIEGRDLGHGDHRTARGIQEDGHAAPRSTGLHRVRQDPLDHVLDRGIQGELQVRPRLGFHHGQLRRKQGPAPRVPEHRTATRPPAHQLVVAGLEPGQALVVGAHEAEDGGRQLPKGVVPLALPEEVDPREIQGGDRGRLGRIELPCEEDEVPVPGEPLFQLPHRERQDLRQDLCRRSGIAHLRRVGPDGFHFGGDREEPAPGVVDRAPGRLEIQDPSLLRGRPVPIVVVAGHLEMAQAHDQPRHPKGHQDPDGNQASGHGTSSTKTRFSGAGGTMPSSSVARRSTRSGAER